jgi:hypothetical protein
MARSFLPGARLERGFSRAGSSPEEINTPMLRRKH